MRAKPLASLKVLDLTRLLPGAMCTLHLADMGADVLKVEDTGLGDYSRWAPPKKKTTNAFFLASNRNKRSMKLDLKQQEGREIFFRLAREADVVVESFRPGVVDKLGIGYAAVAAVNPRLVYCSISGYGQTGPYRDRAGHDINYLAYAGIANQIGPRGGAPVVPGIQIADLIGGSLNGAMGILAAVIDARLSGLGRYIDVSMTDGALAHAVYGLTLLEGFGHVPGRGDSPLSGGGPGYNIYETEDGRYVALSAIEEKFWRLFCEAVERPDLIKRHVIIGPGADAVRDEVAAIIKAKPLAHWAELADRVDCALAPVLTLAETMDNEQIQAREMVVIEDHPTDGPIRQFALPLKFSDFQFSVDLPAPGHGEHTRKVLAGLGYSAAEIEGFEAAKVV